MTMQGRNSTATIVVAVIALFVLAEGTFDYKDALTKSIIFLEAQRSGKLPPNHRPAWREDSGLDDGKLANVELVGGYYDAGDNVKYGFPMAFTVTTLAWNTIFYKSELQATGELANAEAGIRWGTDFFLKAVKVGDPVMDHQCWVRPEIMQTPRTVLYIDANNPGTEIAAETSAAMASASMVFRTADKVYSRRLLKYITEEAIGATVNEFSWDLKYAGAQILLSKVSICSVLPESPFHQVFLTPGGLIHLRDGANTQYVTGTAFLFTTYGDLLARYHQSVNCGGQQFDSSHLIAFAVRAKPRRKIVYGRIRAESAYAATPQGSVSAESRSALDHQLPDEFRLLVQQRCPKP